MIQGISLKSDKSPLRAGSLCGWIKDMDDLFKTPRLYIDAPLAQGADMPVPEAQAHYLKNVMRRQPGDFIRLFNGRDGEWQASLVDVSKKGVTARVMQRIKEQLPIHMPRLSIICPPLKKDAQDVLIEKASELGIAGFYPVITDHTDVRTLHADRITAQMIEAAEQCERMDIPTLAPLRPLMTCLAEIKGRGIILAAIERSLASPLYKVCEDLPRAAEIFILVGPAGGFSASEKEKLGAHENIIPVSLGDRILRAETAAIAMLSVLQYGAKERIKG